jgi:hypothetical protein
VSEATKWPRCSAVHSRWSEAVASGVQDRNCSASTPSTLIGFFAFPSLIAAPSADTMLRTPLIRRSFLSWLELSPVGSITSRSGR